MNTVAAPAAGPVRLRNRMALFIWGFAAVWLGMLAAMSCVSWRDGPPEGYSSATMLAILLVFWVFGGGLLAFAASRPCYSVTVDGSGEAALVWRYPFRVVRVRAAAGQIGPATLVHDEDSEGDAYYYARVEVPGRRPFDLAEGHRRERVEQACQVFNQAVRGHRA